MCPASAAGRTSYRLSEEVYPAVRSEGKSFRHPEEDEEKMHRSVPFGAVRGRRVERKDVRNPLLLPRAPGPCGCPGRLALWLPRAPGSCGYPGCLALWLPRAPGPVATQGAWLLKRVVITYDFFPYHNHAPRAGLLAHCSIPHFQMRLVFLID